MADPTLEALAREIDKLAERCEQAERERDEARAELRELTTAAHENARQLVERLQHAEAECATLRQRISELEQAEPAKANLPRPRHSWQTCAGGWRCRKCGHVTRGGEYPPCTGAPPAITEPSAEEPKP